MKNTELLHKKNNKSRNHLLKLLVLLAFFPVIVFAADPPGIPDGWSDGFVYDNGVRIHYYHAVPAPGKPVMVMVHGVTDNGLCWTTLTWQLQDDYDIYMLDTRGHGLSDPFTSHDDGETLIKDVVGFVKAMNFEKPILMGHSMGAATVMRLGAEYSDLPKAVIMLDPFLSARGGNRRGGTHQAPPINSPESHRSEVSVPEDISVQMFADPETLVKQNNYDFDDLVELGHKQNPKWDVVDIKYWALSKKQYHGPYAPEAWQAMSGTMRTGDALSKIVVPSLILKADTSPERKKANEEAVDGLDRVKLIHLEGTGHNLHHDDLERTVKEIIEFLSKNQNHE